MQSKTDNYIHINDKNEIIAHKRSMREGNFYSIQFDISYKMEIHSRMAALKKHESTEKIIYNITLTMQLYLGKC